jgi:hypothetical protein
MNVRLKVNMIIDGKNYPRGSVVDDQLIPERFRTEEFIASLEDTGGKVLLLRDLSFQSLPRPSADGIATSFPTHLAMGELLDLTQVPEGERRELIEGLDFRQSWSHEEMVQLQKAQEDIYRDSESYQPDAGLMRRNR